MLWSALALGFLGSLHCLGMCGPIVFMLPLDRVNNGKKLLQLGLYHFGRLLAYALLGLTFGYVGKGLQLFGLQQKLSIAIGLVMIAVVLVPSKYFSGIGLTKPLYKAIGKVKAKLGKELKKQTPDTFLTIGFLNGFLPCGLVYMALFGAIAMANPWQGGAYMVFFALGTMPLMTTAVYIGNFFTAQNRAKVRKLIPVFVVLIGVLFIVRGMGLGIPYVSPKTVQTKVIDAQVECHQP